MKKRVFRRWADDPESLVELLVARLGISKEAAVDLVEGGSVSANLEAVLNPRARVGVGVKLTVRLAAPVDPPPLVVVFRDDDVAVVDKPAGLPSQPEPGQRAYCLSVAATRDLGAGARVMHRLDKDASGL